MVMSTDILVFKAEGNTQVKNGKYLAAIQWQVDSDVARLSPLGQNSYC